MRVDETKLMAYLDDELSASEREVVERQLAASPQWQAALSRLQAEAKRLDQTLDLIAPDSATHSAAPAALKRLQTDMAPLDQTAPAAEQLAAKESSVTVWESPSLLTQIKSAFGSIKSVNGSSALTGWLSLLGVAGLIAVMIAAGLMLRPALDPSATETPSAQPSPLPVATAPDSSERILFRTNAGIFVIDADGSNLTPMTNDKTTLAPIAWSPDRQKIAYTSARSGNPGLQIINVDGVDQTTLRRSATLDWKPAWSPDGQKIAFVSGPNVNPDIYLVGVDGVNPYRLIENGNDPAWSPDGQQVAFVRDYHHSPDIYLKRIDQSPPVQLTNDSAENFDPAWSPDGQRLAFRSGQQGKFDIYTINPDGSGQTRLTHHEAGGMKPVWSPDGQRLAFAAAKDDQSTIYIINADGSGQLNLANGWHPAWSPDGQWLAFAAGPDEAKADLYVIRADGAQLTRLTDAPARFSTIEWALPVKALPPTTPQPLASTDEVQILFQTNSGVYLMHGDGTNLTRLTESKSGMLGATWSPDGRRIAFLAEHNDNSALYVMGADGANPTRLTESQGLIVLPTWSPDGQRLAFAAAQDDSVGSDVNFDLYTINADGSDLVRLTDSPASDVAPAWSPDGRRIVFSSLTESKHDIYTIEADGANLTQLTDNSAQNWLPAWSPDGQKIAFFSEQDDEQNIYVMNSDGSNPVQLVHNTGSVFYSVPKLWSPDGKSIAFIWNHSDAAALYTIRADGTGLTRLSGELNVGFSFDWSPDGRRIVFATHPNETPHIYVVDADGANLTHLTATEDGLVHVEWRPRVGAAPAQKVVQAVVALRDIPQGSPFEAGSIGRRAWPAEHLPPGAIAHETETFNRVAKTDIVRGQVIVRGMLGPPGSARQSPRPLAELVLQQEDLPQETMWQASGPILLDSPSNPLYNSPAFEAETISENYHIFAIAPLPQPGKTGEVGTPVINHIYRYDSAEWARKQWQSLIESLENERLQEIIQPDDTQSNEGTTKKFVARLIGDEGETIYWGILQQNNLLEILVVDDISTISGDANPLTRQFFISLMDELQQKIEESLQIQIPEIERVIRSEINSYEECITFQNLAFTSYPSKCLGPDGRWFDNPAISQTRIITFTVPLTK